MTTVIPISNCKVALIVLHFLKTRSHEFVKIFEILNFSFTREKILAQWWFEPQPKNKILSEEEGKRSSKRQFYFLMFELKYFMNKFYFLTLLF